MAVFPAPSLGQVRLKQSTTYKRAFFMASSTDLSGITGQNGSLVVKISKAGAAFGTAAGATAEIGLGWYSVLLSAADTGTIGDLAYNCACTGASPTNFVDQVQAQVFSDLLLNASGQALIASNVKQNAVLNGFTFVMTNVTTHTPATGLTVVAQRSLAGAGFAPCVNGVTELSNGVYNINLAASDTNAVTVMLRFTASGADDLNIMLITQP